MGSPQKLVAPIVAAFTGICCETCRCRGKGVTPADIKKRGSGFSYQYVANSNIARKSPLLSKRTATANLSRGIDMRHIQPAKLIPTTGRKPAQKAKETVTLRHLATAMAEGHGLPKAKANAMLADMVAAVTRHLKKGARIRVNGLGIFQVRKRRARMGR